MSVSRTDGSNDKGVVRTGTAAPNTFRCLVQMDLMTRVLYVREQQPVILVVSRTDGPSENVRKQQPLIRVCLSYKWI